MLDKIPCKFNSMDFLANGNIRIAFEVENAKRNEIFNCINEISSLVNKCKDKLILTLKQYREKRSLNANAYLWVLLQKIAEATNIDKETVYLQMLQRYSRVFTHVICKPNSVDKFTQQWRTVINLGEVTVNGTKGIQLQCYFGSSTYDSKEMSVLINGVVDECKALGIETATPQELSLMCEEWGK